MCFMGALLSWQLRLLQMLEQVEAEGLCWPMSCTPTRALREQGHPGQVHVLSCLAGPCGSFT
jgi:hypothetical protein